MTTWGRRYYVNLASHSPLSRTIPSLHKLKVRQLCGLYRVYGGRRRARVVKDAVKLVLLTKLQPLVHSPLPLKFLFQ